MLQLLTLALAASGPLPVSYVVHEERTVWQPIEPVDIESTVGHAALEALSKSGLASLELVTDKDLRDTRKPYVLRITGRMLDEAETHTVFLSFEPGSESPLGSLRSSDTVSLSKQSRAVMLQRIEESSKRAAADLATGLKRLIDAQKPGAEKNPKAALEPPPLPWHWLPVAVAAPPSLRSSADLDSGNYAKRQAALRELTSLALSENAPRHVLEHCVLKHRDKDTRLGCLKALRPLARRLAPTQRVVIEAFRTDADRDVKGEANDQMQYFGGVSRLESINAWLELAAQGDVWGPLSQLGDLPSLDNVVARCLVASGKKPKYERSKRGCIELMDPIPQPRRKAILWRFLEELNPDSPYYIEGQGPQERSSGTDWEWALDKVIKGAASFEPGLEEILWRRYERTFSATAIKVLGKNAPPSPLMTQRFLEVVQTAGERDALWGLERFVDADPSLRPTIKDKVAELLATEAYHKSVSRQSLEELLKKASK